MNRGKSNRKRGSILLMAVGILVMLAMVGMTYVVVSHLDQRESASLAGQAPITMLGAGTVDRAKAILMEDLGFSSDTGYPFQRADNWLQWVDDDSQYVDPWLASAIPVDTDGDDVLDTYPHATDLFDGDRTSDAFNDVPWQDAPADGGPVKDAAGRWLVDTDGDGKTDSILVPSKVRDRDGNYFYVAARIIDLSALLDLRVVGAPSYPHPFSSGSGGNPNYYMNAYRGCPVTDLDFSRMGTPLSLADLHAWRCAPNTPTLMEYNNASVRKFRNMMGPDNSVAGVCNFGQDDLLSLLWRENAAGSSTSRLMRGRLYDKLHSIDSSDDLYRPVPELSPALDHRQRQPEPDDPGARERPELHLQVGRAIPPGRCQPGDRPVEGRQRGGMEALLGDLQHHPQHQEPVGAGRHVRGHLPPRVRPGRHVRGHLPPRVRPGH